MCWIKFQELGNQQETSVVTEGTQKKTVRAVVSLVWLRPLEVFLFLASALFVLHAEFLGQGHSFQQFRFFPHDDAFYDKNIGLVIDANCDQGIMFISFNSNYWMRRLSMIINNDAEWLPSG